MFIATSLDSRCTFRKLWIPSSHERTDFHAIRSAHTAVSAAACLNGAEWEGSAHIKQEMSLAAEPFPHLENICIYIYIHCPYQWNYRWTTRIYFNICSSSERSDPTQVAALAEAAQQAVGMPKDLFFSQHVHRHCSLIHCMVCRHTWPRFAKWGHASDMGQDPRSDSLPIFFWWIVLALWDWWFWLILQGVIADPFWDANQCYGCFFNHLKRTSQFLKFKSYTSCFVWSLT